MGFAEQFDFFHGQASIATGGLDDFGEQDYQAPMRLMLADIDRFANLNELGRQICATDIITLLVGRLHSQQGFKQYPEYLDNPIKKPIIIAGLPRTGSTVLHRLLSEDPDSQALPMWLGIMPRPRPPVESWPSLPDYQQVVNATKDLYMSWPAIKGLHPMVPAENDECRLAYGQSFWNPGHCSIYHMPEYTRWCLETDATFAYRYYRKVLALVAGGSYKHWILKDPCHMWNLTALLNVFPDAQIVMTYRDPLQSSVSLSSMMYQLRQKTEMGLTKQSLGKQILQILACAMAKVNEERKQINPKQIFEVHFNDIRNDPIGTMNRIYNYFDRPIEEQTKKAWENRIKTKPNEGHVAHKYTAEEFGLTLNALNEVAGDYYHHYLDIESKSIQTS